MSDALRLSIVCWILYFGITFALKGISEVKSNVTKIVSTTNKGK
jgi:hypothetical protein